MKKHCTLDNQLLKAVNKIHFRKPPYTFDAVQCIFIAINASYLSTHACLSPKAPLFLITCRAVGGHLKGNDGVLQ